MKPLLPRRYLAENVETALLEAMKEGRFGEYLPGERRLATLLGVSRPTLRVALGVLTKQGYLQVEQGRRTRIVQSMSHVETPASTGRVMLLTKGEFHELSPAMLYAIDLLRTQLEERGLHLDFRPCHAFLHTDPSGGLERLVLENPSDAWLLLHSPVAVQAWFHKKDLPAIVLGTPADGVALPGVDTDFRPAVRHACAQLVAAGHEPESIALLLPDLDLPGHRAMMAGFTDGGGSIGAVLRHPVDFTHVSDWVDRRFMHSKQHPTAVIVAWPKMALTLMTRLGLAHGWKIPARLSVVCLSHDPAFEMVQPLVSHYRRDSQRYVALLVRLILRTTKHLSDADESRNLMPEYIKGDSIAPPAGEK